MLLLNNSLYVINFSKSQFEYKEKMIKFGDVSDVWTTWYERLTKPKLGFSFNQSTSLISYIDAAMREECGPPENNVLWTREKLRDLKDRIISDIKKKFDQG